MSDFCRYNPPGSRLCTQGSRAWKPCPYLDENCSDRCPLDVMAELAENEE